MKANIGTIDRGLRIIFALVVGLLYVSGQISGMTSIVLLIVAGVLLLTSLVGICPIYLMLGLSSRSSQPE